MRLSCIFCDYVADTLSELKRHSAECRNHPLFSSRRNNLAMHAMQGLLANPNIVGWSEHRTGKAGLAALDCADERRQIAFRAYQLSEEMLTEAGRVNK